MDETSPWTPLLYNLAGINRPPKARQAFQQYMAESYDTEIAPVVEARWKSTFLEDDGVTLKTKKNHNAAFRSKIAREMYSKLSEERQDGIKRRLKEAAQQAKDEYARTMKSGPSQAPEDRQRCIDTVGPFVNELLSRVAEYTGLQSVMVLGGPIPSSGGELETRVFGYSENPDRAFQDSEQFDTKVLDFMKEFLHTAFSKCLPCREDSNCHTPHPQHQKNVRQPRCPPQRGRGRSARKKARNAGRRERKRKRGSE
ncbi:hypothetical protein C8R47DRAFT_146408 [Mycena vitilis]|nr:hypothetical protein C8R47DRAFT_146408 [Mycena vitilis]